MHPYPLQLNPVLLEKVWGGDSLRAFGKTVAPGATIGESWELADLATTSSSGAGGGAVVSTIRNGELSGRTIRDAANAFAGALRPGRPVAEEFPLLVKFLDAREHLSVQVHPSPAYAAAHPEAKLKTECWIILHAEPGAQLFLGLQDGATVADVPRLGAEGRVLETLKSVPAVVGECHTLPSGLVHALGAGIVIAEVQAASDTTFRLYDWTLEYSRPPRALHVAESIEATLLDAKPETRRVGPGRTRLVDTTIFTVDHIVVDATPVVLGGSDRARPVTCIAGSAVLESPGAAPVTLSLGDTVLVAGSLAAATTIRGTPTASVLVSTEA